MAAILFVILIGVIIGMPAGLPVGRKDAKFTEVLSKNRNINWLSAARLFLFGARDVWFVVGIPIYFYAVLSDGSVESKREAFFMIVSFMAVWTILYGAVQGWPRRYCGPQAGPRAKRSHRPATGTLRWSSCLPCLPRWSGSRLRHPPR